MTTYTFVQTIAYTFTVEAATEAEAQDLALEVDVLSEAESEYLGTELVNVA